MRSMYEYVGVKADLAQQFLFILHGGAVKRFHTVATVKDVTVAQHQHNVAWLCWMLTQGACSANLLMAALSHDLPEVVWGDMPSPTKVLLRTKGETLQPHEEQMLCDNEMVFPLSDEEQIVLKIADRMGGMLDCIHERTLGNHYVELPFGRFCKYTRELLIFRTNSQHWWDIYYELQRLWDEAITDPTKMTPAQGSTK